MLSSSAPLPLQVEVCQDPSGHSVIQIASRLTADRAARFCVHSRAVVRDTSLRGDPAKADLDSIRKRLASVGKVDSFYQRLRALGIESGPAFCGLHAMWQKQGEALGRIRLPEAAGSDSGYSFHPALLDACIQVLAGCFAEEEAQSLWLPVRLDRFALLRQPGQDLFCHAVAVDDESSLVPLRRGDLRVTDETGAIVAELHGLCVQKNRRWKSAVTK